MYGKPYGKSFGKHRPHTPGMDSRPHPGPRYGAPPPVAKASVVRTVNFRRLAEAAGGAEALGSMLDMTIGRLKALEEGQDFSDETAFHLELELNLPSGWFDQKDPPVPRVISRKEDTDETFFSGDLEISRKLEENKLQSSSTPAKAEPELPRQTEATAPKTVPQVGGLENENPAPVQKTAPSEVTEMSTVNVSDAVQAARLMRRANLVALTSWPRAKSSLARLMNKTPANISHLIHGEKNFDREAAVEIERVLALPENWFEVNRRTDDVPEQVIAVLSGVAPGQPLPQPVVQGASTGRKRGRPRRSEDTSGVGQQTAAAPSAVPASTATSTQNIRLAPAAAPAKAPVAAQAGLPLAQAPRIAPRAAPAQPVSGAAPAAPQDESLAMPRGPVMSEHTRRMLRESEGVMGPIAEALVKTIIEKSRSGNLTEKAAYKMLSEVMDN